jgi:hypothetical protein
LWRKLLAYLSKHETPFSDSLIAEGDASHC